MCSCCLVASPTPLLQSMLGGLRNHRPDVLALDPRWGFCSDKRCIQALGRCNIQLIQMSNSSETSSIGHVLILFPHRHVLPRAFQNVQPGARKIPSNFAGGIKAQRRIKPLLTNPDVISSKALRDNRARLCCGRWQLIAASMGAGGRHISAGPR